MSVSPTTTCTNPELSSPAVTASAADEALFDQFMAKMIGINGFKDDDKQPQSEEGTAAHSKFADANVSDLLSR